MAVERLNIPDNIIIVLKHGGYLGTSIRQGFVVDPTNIKQLETARDWGKVSVKQFDFGQYEVIQPEEVYTSNDGFSLTFLDAAGTSSQGGKLSFWNCLIEKGDMKAVIGIQQDNILSLIKQSNILKGTINNLSLAKKGSTACVCHPEMAEWKISKTDKNAPKAKKTSKWQVGKSYRTLTKHELYMGNIYKWFNESTTYEEQRNPSNMFVKTQITHHHYKLMNHPSELKIVMDLSSNYAEAPNKVITENGATSLNEVFKSLINRVNEVRASNGAWAINRASHIFGYGTLMSSTPSREIGEVSLDTENYQEGLAELLKVCRSKYVEALTNDKYLRSDIFENAFSYTASPDIKPVFSEEDVEFILNNCSETIHIDFGDGIKHTGRKKNG